MAVKKKGASGGAVLLKEKGSEYFSQLAKKGAEKRKELEKKALLWEKSQIKKKKTK